MRRIGCVVAIAVVVVLVASVVLGLIFHTALGPIGAFLHAYRWWIPAVAAVVGALLISQVLPRMLGQPRAASWRSHVLTAADAIQHELEARPVSRNQSESAFQDSVANAVLTHLKAARRAAAGDDRMLFPLFQVVVERWSGATVQTAFFNLHRAEIALVQLLPDSEIRARIPEALARLQTMDGSDPRRLAAALFTVAASLLRTDELQISSAELTATVNVSF